MKYYSLFLIILIFPFSIVSSQEIEVFSPTAPSTSVEFSVNPRNPAPYEDIEVSLSGGALRLSRITSVKWFVDDVEQEPAKNDFSIDTKTKGIGDPLRISVIVEANDLSVQLQQSAIILPIVFDVLWEGQTSVPVGYKGRPLVTLNSPLRLVSLIDYIDENGLEYSTDDFFFSWEKDYFDSVEGYAKNYIDLDKPPRIGNSFDIIVKAQSNNSKVSLEKTVRVNVEQPKVYIYSNHPVYGLVNNRVVSNSVRVLSDDFQLSAQPLFFPTEDVRLNNINYQWSLGDTTIQSGVNSREISLAKNTSGEDADLFLEIRNTDSTKIFHNASRNIYFKFE